MEISESTLIQLIKDVSTISSNVYKDLLVEQGHYTYDELHIPGNSNSYDWPKMNKKDLCRSTLRDLSDEKRIQLIESLFQKRLLSNDSIAAIKRDGIQLGQSIAGDLVNPFDEESILESSLKRQGFNGVIRSLNQSFENYINGNYEASNAMSRTALEEIVKEIALKISSSRGETVPSFRVHINPTDYRRYLQNVHFLGGSEYEWLDKFFNYASLGGSHPGNSSEAEARLRRFVIVPIALLFLEKLDDNNFMSRLQ